MGKTYWCGAQSVTGICKRGTGTSRVKKEKVMLQGFFYCLTAFFIALCAVAATGSVFDRMEWSTFHTWGILHGSIIYIFPLYFITSWLIVWLIGKWFAVNKQSK
jgi:hypothetical protein